MKWLQRKKTGYQKKLKLKKLKNLKVPFNEKKFLYKSIKNEWQKFHSKKKNKKIKLHEPTFGVEEIFKFTKQLITTNVTMGKQVESFEKKICDKFGFKYAVSSNSGSSANLLMISALMSNLYSKRLKK